MEVGNPCHGCAPSPWVQRANQFVASNAGNSSLRPHVITLSFLLKNGNCGIKNRVTIEDILHHLGQEGFTLNREEFQNQVLTQLKREGTLATLVYPGRQGGVFIPYGDDDLQHVTAQIMERLVQELTNLEGSAASSKNEPAIRLLRKIVEVFKDSL